MTAVTTQPYNEKVIITMCEVNIWTIIAIALVLGLGGSKNWVNLFNITTYFWVLAVSDGEHPSGDLFYLDARRGGQSSYTFGIVRGHES